MLKSRIAWRYLKTGSTDANSITVNVYDDSPPEVPIYVEGDLRKLRFPEVEPEQVIDFLAGMTIGAGYEILATGPYAWQGSRYPLAFKVVNPKLKSLNGVWDKGAPKEDRMVWEQIHHEFLQELVHLFSGKAYAGHPLQVISES